MLRDFFSCCDDIELCATVLSSVEGIEQVRKYNPDVVLTDFIMPNIDGSEVVKIVKKISLNKTKVLILSGVNDTKVINEAFKCGADYYLLKPVSLSFLKEKIISIFNKSRKNNFSNTDKEDRVNLKNYENRINVCIQDIGMPITLSGYDYAVEAITVMLKSDRGMMLKEINSIIAKKNCTSIQCVDACLHNAILKAHENSNAKYKSLFGEIKRYPSNYVFLRTVREYIRNTST